jgi:hypothetical protein
MGMRSSGNEGKTKKIGFLGSGWGTRPLPKNYGDLIAVLIDLGSTQDNGQPSAQGKPKRALPSRRLNGRLGLDPCLGEPRLVLRASTRTQDCSGL